VDLFVHGSVRHESEECFRDLREAAVMRILNEAFEELNVFLLLEHLVAVVHYIVEIIF
jgi:hypothetical protein